MQIEMIDDSRYCNEFSYRFNRRGLSMFDTVAGILENGPYCPKDASRNSWEGMMRDYFDDADNCRKTSVCQTLNRP